MVDFNAALDAWYAGLTDEERQRVETAKKAEAEASATEIEIIATFERISWKVPDVGASIRNNYDVKVDKTWTEAIKMRIEKTHDMKEVLVFIGGPTGYERYSLDEDLCNLLTDPEERARRPNWCICGGTPNRWDKCTVSNDDVEDYLREMRPNLFSNTAHTISM